MKPSTMAKPVSMNWTQRRRAMPKSKGVSSNVIIGFIALFALAAAPWLLVPFLGRAPASDTHVVSMDRVAGAWEAPLGKGRLSLSFEGRGNGSRVRVELLTADGGKRALPAGMRAYLDIPASSGRRARIELGSVGSAFVSDPLESPLPDRSVLIIVEGTFRHVFALDISGAAAPLDGSSS